MRESYYELERRFIEISRIIPFENSGTTHSPRLYDILQTSCGQVENLMRLICDKLEIQYRKKPDFPEYYSKLNKTNILEIQAIDYFPKNRVYQPFVLEPKKESPSWWNSYNKTKHNLPEGYREGNLNNTIRALSAVYALHCLAAYCNSEGNEIMIRRNWRSQDAISMKTLQPTIEMSWENNDIRPRSSIFYPIMFFYPLGDLNE